MLVSCIARVFKVTTHSKPFTENPSKEKKFGYVSKQLYLPYKNTLRMYFGNVMLGMEIISTSVNCK